MAYSPSPLAVIENHFTHLAPTHLTVCGATCHPWLQDRTYSLYELRDVLMHEETPKDVRDAVWRHTIRTARLSQDWTVGALGLCMPALRSIARRACRGLDPGGVDTVESAILCEAIHQIRSINLAYARLAWYLTKPVYRAALSARKHEKEAPIPVEDPGRKEDPDPGVSASPDLLLVSAVRVGVLSRAEVRLISRTRLENVPLLEVAEQTGVPYKTLAKRRERAEARLVAAVHAGDVVVADALICSDDLPARVRGALRLVKAAPTSRKSLSHRSFPLAS